MELKRSQDDALQLRAQIAAMKLEHDAAIAGIARAEGGSHGGVGSWFGMR